MRKLVYYVASTLDGFIAGPDGSVGFIPFSVDSDLARYIQAEYPETLPTAYRQAVGFDDAPNRHFDTVLMGRGTYEPALKEGITSPYAHLRQYVFSRTIVSTDPAVTVVADDPVEFVRGLKREDGLDVWLGGGGEFAGVLWPEVDEVIVKLNPVTAGEGIPLARRGFDPTLLTLRAAKPLQDGVVVLHYTRAAATQP
jgi:dihydrofolate reductase